VLNFTLTVAFGGGGAVEQLPITVTTGGLGGASTFTYSGPVVPIPDGLGADVRAQRPPPISP
jgi:hypothetical protein